MATKGRHFHGITCPYCFGKVEIVECHFDDCGSPFESKKPFPFALTKTCPHCGETFYADFGNEPQHVITDRLMEIWEKQEEEEP